MKKILNFFSNFFIQIGKSIMLPITILPIAGILLRLGQPDVFDIPFIAAAGGAIFDNLPVIFALGIGVGFSKDGSGVAALSAFIGYTVLTKGLAVLAPSLDLGVLGGIVIGVTSGYLYNRFCEIKLPNYLAFFSGKRAVPIITGFVAIFLAVVFYFIWPPVQGAIAAFGNWIISSGNLGLFAWGVANRLLIPTGLHHILNTLVYFNFGSYNVVENGVNVVKTGDLWRFWAGDKTAGSFMAGFYPVIMFGLPGACLAMIMAAPKSKCKIASAFLISAAFAAFLTGITEIIEFSFLFVSFPLYVVHALLSGVSMIIMNMLHVKIGYMFSAGAIDYALAYKVGTNSFWVIPVGIAYSVIYFVIFYFSIKIFNLKTIGRDEDSDVVNTDNIGKAEVSSNLIEGYIEALGGKTNIKGLSACTTRLRVDIIDKNMVNSSALKGLGAKGVIFSSDKHVQVIVGFEALDVCTKIKAVIG